MSWVRLDDQFPNHAKIMSVGSDAFRLHVTAMCWAANQLTDGAVPVVATRQLGWFCADLKQSTTELETAGLWDVAPGGWLIHDFLDYNPSREQVTKERTEAKERMRNKRGSSAEVRPNISRTSDNVQAPPSPSPSPSPLKRDEGIARPPASAPVTDFPEHDPDWGVAISKLEGARIGGMSGSVLLELNALWPDFANGRRDWLDDAILVAKANNAHSPTYAIRVLAGALRDNKRPGSVPEAKPRQGGRTKSLDEILGITPNGK